MPGAILISPDDSDCALEDAPNLNGNLNFKLNKSEVKRDNDFERDLDTINVWTASKGRHDATLNVSSSKVSSFGHSNNLFIIYLNNFPTYF